MEQKFAQNRYYTGLKSRLDRYFAVFISLYILALMKSVYKVSLVSYFFLIKKVKIVHKRCSTKYEREIGKKVGYHGYGTYGRIHAGSY